MYPAIQTNWDEYCSCSGLAAICTLVLMEANAVGGGAVWRAERANAKMEQTREQRKTRGQRASSTRSLAANQAIPEADTVTTNFSIDFFSLLLTREIVNTITGRISHAAASSQHPAASHPARRCGGPGPSAIEMSVRDKSKILAALWCWTSQVCIQRYHHLGCRGPSRS